MSDNEKQNLNPQEPEENRETHSPAPEQGDEDIKEIEKEEKDAGPEPETKEKGRAVKNFFTSSKFKRGSITTAFTVGFLVVIVLINVIVSILGQRYPSINLDLTQNSVNTLSEQAAKVVAGVKEPVTIYIMGTESQVKNDQILTNYGIRYSQVGILASKMAERNSNIKIQYVDLVKNPTFANQYKSDNLQEGDVVVKSAKRDRVLTYTDLFNVQYSQDGQSTNTYSMVDSGLASGLNSVVADTLPVVAFDTGHSEQMDATTYKSLLAGNSFETKDFNILTDKIPDKTQLVVLGCPTTDYTEGEINKLDSFLSSTSIAGDRSLMITFFPNQKTMPNLAAFLKEWGMEVPQAVVVESDQSKYYTNDASYILSNVQTKLSLGGKGDYGYFSTPQSNPVNILYDSRGSRTTYALATSNDTCYLVDNNTKSTDKQAKKAYNTAALCQDTVKSGDKTYKANVIALGSTTMFTGQILGANTFGNARYVVDLSKYATGTGNTATAITSTPVQTTVSDITLDTQKSTLLGLGVFTLLLPLLIACAGILVFSKRRHL